MKLNIGEKELKIKFGYKPTLKERLISRIVKMSRTGGENEAENMEKMEDLLLFLPEILLIGLQVHHEDFRYDYDTKEGKEEQLNRAFDLIDEYSIQDGADLMHVLSLAQYRLHKVKEVLTMQMVSSFLEKW